jgi:predicted enzyme related to lactoylglutathione lyase
VGNPVVHFEVTGKNGDGLVSFYEQMFDWKTQGLPELGYTLVEKEGDGIAGGIGSSQDDGPGHVTFYVQVEDPQAALDKAESLGGRTVLPVMTIPNTVTLALFADPEGHVVGLVARETQES